MERPENKMLILKHIFLEQHEYFSLLWMGPTGPAPSNGNKAQIRYPETPLKNPETP